MKKEGKIKLIIGINDFLVGGAQKLIVDQLKVFDRNLFDITLVTLSEFPERKNFYQELPADLKCLRLNFRGFYDFKSWVNLLKLLREIKPDVVCSHLFLSNTIFRLLKPLVGYKIIVVEHNTYIYKRKSEIWMDKLLSYLTYRIIAVSRTVKDFASKQAGISLNKFIVIENGIDQTPIASMFSAYSKVQIREELGLANEDLVFLSNGRLTAQKNQALLVESFVKFQKTHPNAKLIIMGEGTLLSQLQTLAKEAPVGKIQLLTAVPHELVLKYFRGGDFLVSTSLIEGMSIAYLEALASGLPIVATKTAGTDDLINDGVNGIFIAKPSVHAVVEALEKALTLNHLTAEDKARENAKRFDVSVNVKKYSEIILEALN